MPYLLMRENFKQLLTRHTVNDAHAGVLIQKGLKQWETDDEKKRIRERGDLTEKDRLINKVKGVSASELYLLAFNRWLKTTYSEENDATFAHISAKIVGRLYTGLSEGSTLETGVTTHHSYGMPMLSGSSVKGAVRSYAEQLFAQRDGNNDIIYHEENHQKKIVIQEDKQEILDILFGKDSNDEDSQDDAGYIIWHDVWWIPPVTKEGALATNSDSKPHPFVEEIVTVHQQQYYRGDIEQALDMESPNPSQQLAIQGGFYFALEGDAQWVQFAKTLLEKTLQAHGIGAKGSSGYGYFVLDEKLEKDIRTRVKKASLADKNDEYADLRKYILDLNEKKLIKTLSAGIKKLFREYELDIENEQDCRIVVEIVLECHDKMIEKWNSEENKNKENMQKAYKFIATYSQ